MKLKIATICLLLGAQPAWACHRFSKWYYPYPQRCSVSTKAERGINLARLSPSSEVMPPSRSLIEPSPSMIVEDPLPDSIIVEKVQQLEFVSPPLDDWNVIEHEAAMMKLRLIQENKWKDK